MWIRNGLWSIDKSDQMETVYQAKELSMAWCIECHRKPEPHLRPVEYVTKLDWEPTNENGEPMTEDLGYTGYLIRSKPAHATEGGVHSGQGMLDSLALVD